MYDEYRVKQLQDENRSLLIALKSLVKSLSEQDEEGLIEHAEPMIAARAAIAKATGGCGEE